MKAEGVNIKRQTRNRWLIVTDLSNGGRVYQVALPVPFSQRLAVQFLLTVAKKK